MSLSRIQMWGLTIYTIRTSDERIADVVFLGKNRKKYFVLFTRFFFGGGSKQGNEITHAHEINLARHVQHTFCRNEVVKDVLLKLIPCRDRKLLDFFKIVLSGARLYQKMLLNENTHLSSTVGMCLQHIIQFLSLQSQSWEPLLHLCVDGLDKTLQIIS